MRGLWQLDSGSLAIVGDGFATNTSSCIAFIDESNVFTSSVVVSDNTNCDTWVVQLNATDENDVVIYECSGATFARRFRNNAVTVRCVAFGGDALPGKSRLGLRC